jgi:glycosyltransferase involved in cell wall biosynthesis
MRVRLIGKANGVGLSRDFDMLEAPLRASGCDVQRQPCDRRERRRRRSLLTTMLSSMRGLRAAHEQPKADVNIMLEHVWPQFLHQARYNVLVPNPEWFDWRDGSLLARMNRVWTKTQLSEQIFVARGCQTVRIGFDSEDRFQSDVVRRPQFLHLAGRSELKGTARLLATWLRHPEWPMLTIVQDASVGKSPPQTPASNIVYENDYLDDVALRRLQNSHQYHLCLSEAEGWGHYVAEAMSVGAVVLTSDAAPMNELVTASRGMLIAAEQGEQHNLVRLALFQDRALEQAIAHLKTLAPAQVETLGKEARLWFLDNKRDFPERVRRAVADIA